MLLYSPKAKGMVWVNFMKLMQIARGQLVSWKAHVFTKTTYGKRYCEFNSRLQLLISWIRWRLPSATDLVQLSTICGHKRPQLPFRNFCTSITTMFFLKMGGKPFLQKPRRLTWSWTKFKHFLISKLNHPVNFSLVWLFYINLLIAYTFQKGTHSGCFDP